MFRSPIAASRTSNRFTRWSSRAKRALCAPDGSPERGIFLSLSANCATSVLKSPLTHPTHRSVGCRVILLLARVRGRMTSPTLVFSSNYKCLSSNPFVLNLLQMPICYFRPPDVGTHTRRGNPILFRRLLHSSLCTPVGGYTPGSVSRPCSSGKPRRDAASPIPCALLRGQKELREAGRVHVAEERRARRQQGWSQKVHIKDIGAGRRRVDQGAGLIGPYSLPVGEHADDGALIIQGFAAVIPALDKAKEVVDSAIGAKVAGRRRRISRNRKGDTFSGHDSGAEIRVGCVALVI